MEVKEELNEKGQQYHICCTRGDVGKYVLLPGDPFRTDLIAQRFDNPVLVAHNREHKTWSGTLDGVKVLGNGELTKAVNVKVAAYTASAKEKIEKAGGKAEVI